MMKCQPFHKQPPNQISSLERLYLDLKTRKLGPEGERDWCALPQGEYQCVEKNRRMDQQAPYLAEKTVESESKGSVQAHLERSIQRREHEHGETL